MFLPLKSLIEHRSLLFRFVGGERKMRWMILGLLFLSCVSPLVAGTITVPDDYPTIQEAIDAAQPGDTIDIKSGIYEEHIHIEKPLILQGENRLSVTIRPPYQEEAAIRIMLNTGELIIENLTIKDAKTGIEAKLNQGAQVEIKNTVIIKNRYGLLIVGVGQFSLVENYLIDNSIALSLFLLGQADIHNNEFLRNNLGIMLGGPVRVQLNKNLLGLCKLGIFTWSTECGFKQNYFSGNITGKENRIYSLNVNICPSYPGLPWPSEFVDEEWSKTINKAFSEYRQGIDAYNARDYQTAINAYKRALIYLKEKEFPLFEAYVYQNLGDTFTKLKKFEEALNCYSIALSIIFERAMETEFNNIITQLRDISTNVLNLSPQKSLKVLKQIYSIFMKYNLELSAADIKVDIGLVYAKSGFYHEALETFTSAQEIYKKHELSNAVILIKQNIAITHALQGSYETALSLLKEVEKYLQDLQQMRAKIETEVGGEILFLRTLAFLGRSISIAHYKLGWKSHITLRSCFSLDEADLWLNIGAVYTELGRYDLALDKLEAASAKYEERKMEVDQADVDFNIASIQAELGQYQEALKTLQRARKIYEKHSLLEDQADVDLNMAAIYIELGEYDNALIKLNKAQKFYQREKLSVQLAYVYTNYGFVYLEKGDEEIARKNFLQALTIFSEKSMKPFVAFLNMAIGDTYINTEPKQALYYYFVALKTSESIPEIRWQTLYKIGLIYARLNEWCKAIDFYEKSVDTLEYIRRFLTRETSKIFWQQKSRKVYTHLISLLIANHNQGSKALFYAERCRARTFLDLLAKGPQGTLENVVEAGIKTGVVDPEEVEDDARDVIRSLPEGTAAIEYFVGEDATYVWVIQGGKISDPVKLPQGREELLEEIIRMREAMEDPTNSVVNYHLLELYEWLIRPIEGLLPETREGKVPHLIIIPSGPLFYLPFQALIWTSEDRSQHAYLIERYTISYAPSLTVLKYAWSDRNQAYPEPCFLGLADPDPKDPKIPRLPAARKEVQAAAGVFPEHRVYVDVEATEEVFQEECGSARHILLSTHGFFNPQNPLFSFLILSPTDGTDGKLHAYEVFGLELGAELVVLSACETLLPSLREGEKQIRAIRGLGEEEPVKLPPKLLEELTSGDEIMGLTRAFFSAGAASVVSSLWSVPSESTAELVAGFYRGIGAGKDKADALREAQLGVLRKGGWEHPYFWAAFCLNGDWSPSPNPIGPMGPIH